MNKIESRHWTFLGLFIVIGLAMFIKFQSDIPVTENTQKLYDYIDSLPNGSTLIVSFDHEASSLPEIRPMALAVLRHAFAKGHKLIGVSLLAEGTLVGYRLMRETGNEYGRTYGKDYVFLGFRPQYIAAILSMGRSIPETYPEDYPGHAYADLEMMHGINNYDDIAGVISIADGSLTTHWIEYGQGRFNVPILAGVTAAMVTTYDPYLASRQLTAMAGGLRGAAEYEQLIKKEGGGLRGMLAQSTAHIYVVLMIIIGNIVYFRSKKKGGG